MYTRVSTINAGAQGIDAAIREFSEVTLPRVRDFPGFERATLLVSREKGIIRLLAYWDSREALDKFAEEMDRLRDEFVEKIGNAMIISVETFEVALDEVSPSAMF
jgi:hypothetical protein